MGITCTCDDRALCVQLSGELDHHGAKAVIQELDRQIGAALPKRLTIDMGGVSFMDSSGIAVLLRARRRMEELEGGLVVRNVPKQADRVFTAAGLHRLLRFE